MSIEKINQAKAEIASTSAYKTITEFFDAESFCEIDAFAKSGEGFAEVVAGFGTVEGMPVYAFAQNSDICGGAMSKAQAAKLKKLYDLALKTGAPVVGFYDSIGGRLSQGTELLAGCGEVLNSAAALSGVVPQISVVLGTCLGTSALNAVSADIVIMSEKAQLSLSVTGENSSAEYNAENGIAAMTAKDTQEAIAMAKELMLYLPSNNLNMAPQSFEEAPNDDGCGCIVSRTIDGNSKVKLYNNYGENANVRLARLGGQVVGIVATKGGMLDCKSTTKVAKFIRFCDAFSLPVISFVNCSGFKSIKCAVKVASAYAEAT
ncbi:MAG: carboxyl transferase domain-containing protein, partial [Ruminococcus sp.]|nr:carboxyl transferase domain-containing protein [Ruminococcus sp.]